MTRRVLLLLCVAFVLAGCPKDTTTTTTTTTSTTSSTTAVSSTTIPNQSPIAQAGPDVFTQTLTSNTFNGSGSSDPGGAIVSYAWTFGDGASANGVTVAHAYASPGTYTARLTVTDSGGLSASDTAAVHVANRTPVAAAGPDQGGTPGQTLSFSGTGSSDPDGTITTYAWNFGDGTSASGSTATHAYAASGTFNVTLTVTDNSGGQGSDSATVTVGGTWSRGFGSPGEDRAQAVAVDASGGVVVAGYFSGTVDFGTGPLTSEHLPWLNPNDYKDVVVARYTAAGVPLWARRVGAEADDRAYAVATDDDGNVAVTGSVSNYVDFGDGTVTGTGGANDAFVAVYAAGDGHHLWSRRVGSSGSETGYAIVVDGAGNVVVAGTFQGTVDFGTGPLTAAGGSTDQDVFVAKYSPAGVPLWAKRFGGTAFEYANGLAVDASDDILMTGAFYGTVAFGGPTLTSAGGYDVHLVKLAAATGTHVWSKRFGGTADDYGNAVAVAGTGYVTLTGYFRNSADFGGGSLTSAGGQDVFVARFTSSGLHQWSRRAGGTGDDSGRGVALTSVGEAIVTGSFQGTADFGGGPLATVGGGDQFVARYGPTGGHLSSRRFGGLGYQYGAAVAVGSAGNPIVAGYFQSTTDFGTGSLTAAGLYDGFLASLAP